MSFRRLTLLFLFSFPLCTFGQASVQLNSAEIKLGIKKLNVVGSVLYMAAHPDDENTRLLAYLAKEKKFRTGYLSLTRGDGGQNLIGNEQSELLGLIRTQELLAARRMDGAEQFFTRAIDFGFSKNPEETFNIWNKEQILADAVWVIRKFRPDMIITRFPEDERAGHGQHSASAIIAREAFFAAGDPKRFPEQLKEVDVWQPLRIVWNTANFGGNNTTSEDQLKLDVGSFNPLLGKSYGEIAAESRTNHKSQGFGSARQRGQAMEYFQHTAGKKAVADIFEGINTGWDKLPGGDLIGKMITSADTNFKTDEPHASLPELIKILTAIEKLTDNYWRVQKTSELKDLIESAAGLWFESYASQPIHTMDSPVSVNSQIILQSNTPVFLKSDNQRSPNEELKPGIVKNVNTGILKAGITDPYWLHEPHSIGMYTIPDKQLLGQPENTAPLQTTFTFIIAGKEISYTRPVVYKFTDQVRGEIYQPLVIAPPVTATIADKAYVFEGNTPKAIQVQLKTFASKAVSGSVTPVVPPGWKVEPSNAVFDFSSKPDEKSVRFLVTPNGKESSGKFSLKINIDNAQYTRGYKTISYEHIPQQSLFPLAEAKVERIDLKTGGKKVGYIAGAGDLIPESLEQVGYTVTRLTENQLLGSDLSVYDAIIAGVRLYNVNEQLNIIQPKLMEYVQNGGTLLVQYNVSNPLKIHNIGPYPFRINRDRVTDENAPVTLVAKEHPALNYPNKITEKDFDGWIQERGLYFTTDADPQYTRLLSMNDPGEKPNDGSVLVADYGKGRFVYTSLAFFRELPAGIPGAYRLFVNLITKNNHN